MTRTAFFKATAMLTISLTLLQGCGKSNHTNKKTSTQASEKITGLTGYVKGAVRVRNNAAALAALACVTQLKSLESAKEMYILSNPGKTPTIDALVKSGFLSSTPKCKAGGTYKLGAPGVAPTCSCGGTHSL